MTSTSNPLPKMAVEYATATEWNLVTLAELCSLSRTPKCRIERQRSICVSMLEVCYRHREWLYNEPPTSYRYLRVREILTAAPSGDVTTALDAWLDAKSPRKESK